MVTFFLVAMPAWGLAAPPPVALGAGASAAPCAYAAALKHDGERALAHSAYLKVLASDPASPCANHGVVATSAPIATSVWNSAGQIAKDAAYAVGAILLALLLVGVAILLWLQVQTRTRWLRDRWPARAIRRPVFCVEPMTDTGTDPLGSAVAGLIRGRVTWRTDRFGLNLVSGQAGVASAFSGLGNAASEAKAAVAVIEFLTALLPRRRFQLTGQLQPAGEEGVGISLELSQNGDAEALTSLWAASFHLTGAPNANAYQNLAVACAAWVDIWMTKAVDGAGLLTSDPQSWAFFRSGVDAQRLGDRKRAQVLYEQALAVDGTNIGALANLGIICRRAGQYEDARDYLERALEPIEGPGMAPHLQPDENPDWYRIKYQIAALYTNWAVDGEPGANRAMRAARSAAEATALVATTLDALVRLDRSGRGQGKASRAYLQDTLRPFLEGTIEPSVLTLLAGSVSPLPPRPLDWPGERPTREAIRESVAENRIDPWQLIAYVEKGPHRPPETQFNLACFYTRAGDLTTASRRLLRAVRETQRQERQRLVDVALLDPVLRPLLEKRPGLKAKLYEMVDAQAPFPDVDELTRHFDRQDRTISHFQSLGYSVAWDVETSDIDLTASKGSQVMLIRLPDPEQPRDAVTSASGMVRAFEQHHAEIKHVKASMVLPAINDYSPDALENARDRGMEVLIDTGRGFEELPEQPPPSPSQPLPG
ncbi:MAG: tetratricopeptide repeat protein [Solirubrobacterales bacterium]|nr:tetratricopeptide repeat protein [Solirubrobacterales bacterium]